jgi:AraC-like DNA-binding protein
MFAWQISNIEELPTTNMLHQVRLLIITLCCLLCHTHSFAQSHSENSDYAKWIDMPLAQLIEKGDDYRKKDSILQAQMCYNIVAERCYANKKRDEQLLGVDACMHLWSIYFYTYYDYPRCFDYLNKAREIMERLNIEDARVWLGLACMYQTISEECHSRELGGKSLEYYIKAMNAAILSHDEDNTDKAATNVVSMASIQNGLKPIANEWRKYEQLPDGKPARVLRRYNKLLYQAYQNIERQEYNQSIAIFDQQLSFIDEQEYPRLVYFTIVEKAKVYMQLSHYDEAINVLRHAEQIADSLHMKDCMLEVYGMLANCHQLSNHLREYENYRERSRALEDTLTTYRQMTSINESEFQNEMKQIEREMNEIQQHRQRLLMMTIMISAFALVVAVFLFILFRQNAKLRHSNRQLYLKNVAMLRAEEASRSEQNKYAGSNLMDDDKQQLLKRIETIMDTSDEVYSPDFSVERLAQLTDSKYKYVSQVINEYYDQNFNNFINQYRIKEACKRIDNHGQYANMTIEAIANSVGFRSRSSFFTSFKRITGLTPSEYLRQSRALNFD